MFLLPDHKLRYDMNNIFINLFKKFLWNPLSRLSYAFLSPLITVSLFCWPQADVVLATVPRDGAFLGVRDHLVGGGRTWGVVVPHGQLQSPTGRVHLHRVCLVHQQPQHAAAALLSWLRGHQAQHAQDYQ